MSEPMLVSSIRKRPKGIIRADHGEGGGAIGTSVAGFLAEYDRAIREAKVEALRDLACLELPAIAEARRVILQRAAELERESSES